METWEMANYADDATPCTADRKVADVINSFEKFAKLLFKWFCDNFMKRNRQKSLTL